MVSNKIITKSLQLGTAIAMAVAILVSCGGRTEKNKKMRNIEFIPAEFSDVDVNYNEEANPCSPYFNDRSYDINILRINTPEKIIARDPGMNPEELVFPVCLFSSFSYLLSVKYDDMETLTIKVRNVNDTDSKEIMEAAVYHEIENSIPNPFQEEARKEIEEKKRELAAIPDQQLNEGTFYPAYLNINLLDYLDLPLDPGTYEIWATQYGQESNHCTVEIVFGK